MTILFYTDTEKVWMEIVEERLKRNCESAITKYSLKSHEKQKSKPERKNGILEPLVPKNRPPKLPFSKEISDGIQIIQTDMRNVSSIIEKFGYKCIPVTAAVVQFGKHLKQQKPDRQKTEEKMKWPGVQEIMESYQRYDRGEYNFCDSCLGEILGISEHVTFQTIK